MKLEKAFPTWRDFIRFVNDTLKTLIINRDKRRYSFLLPDYNVSFTRDFENYNPFHEYVHIINLENPFFYNDRTNLGFDWIIEKQIKEEIERIKEQ